MNYNQNRFIGYVVLGVLLLIPIFFFRPLALIVLYLAMAGAASFGIIFLLNKYQEVKEKKTKSNTVHGIIEARLEQCNYQIEKHSKEVKEIRSNIRDLEFRLNQVIEVRDTTRQETLQVIKGFKKELALRETKIGFYNTCKRKLTTLLYNYNLSQELEKKKAQLSKFQEADYEHIAEMENMKSDMAYDFSFVETITDLSSRMMLSNNIDNAKELQLQLVELTSDLKDL